MVRVIKDMKILERVLSELEPCFCLRLNKKSVEEWKTNGNFAFIKSQITELHDLAFACTELDLGNESESCICSYYFITTTDSLARRIEQMLSYLLFDDKRIPLYKCTESGDCRTKNGAPIKGEIKVCPLI